MEFMNEHKVNITLIFISNALMLLLGYLGEIGKINKKNSLWGIGERERERERERDFIRTMSMGASRAQLGDRPCLTSVGRTNPNVHNGGLW